MWRILYIVVEFSNRGFVCNTMLLSAGKKRTAVDQQRSVAELPNPNEPEALKITVTCDHQLKKRSSSS